MKFQFIDRIFTINFIKFITFVIVCLSLIEAKRVRGRRPVTKPRNSIVVPPISCSDLFEATTDAGDDGPLIRKTQHNDDCKKYFECVTNHWLIRGKKKKVS